MSLIYYEALLCFAFIAAAWALVLSIGSRIKQLTRLQEQYITNLENLRSAVGRWQNTEWRDFIRSEEEMHKTVVDGLTCVRSGQSTLTQELKDMRAARPKTPRVKK